ncbi:EAL domain-containing protein [Novosphingobium sediminicola]|uniref:EAL domain-containing protein (Putative c-di-GMP-specific phosphodiesterase class I) n=1 Tax=Novosphingobium sediminicola TaxID=563162 RepID=A0A7W6CNC7_9SPHN|nr:EAL domain-containing protein [Novosphingobium sediminicola]MBB3957799.1 EAL domain-containing protein (putative c-di-GMP-specific phosphodiesterase class I) [Novosphingobium sediminicola]
MYQPVFEIATGRITSVEALARWDQPSQGPIRPDLFISLPEECGLIQTIGEHMLRQACQDTAGWRSDVRVAVNLSPMQFAPGNLVDIVRSALAETGLAAGRLQLEVTEGLVIRDAKSTFLRLRQLRSMGIQILMDDFGAAIPRRAIFRPAL